jgi:xylan 1,4-beta-xylosidase
LKEGSIKITRLSAFRDGLVFLFCLSILLTSSHGSYAQEKELELSLDPDSATVVLPAIFKPNIDLGGRGFSPKGSWPQELAAQEVLDIWQKDIGFNGIYRLQYNLWNINQLAKDKDLQEELLGNYESIIKKISDSGGIVILDLFSTPAGLGKVLDKRSPPWDQAALKELIKGHIRYLSCQKKYNIWYEVWSAPDLEDFFLGKKIEYFLIYRLVAESVKELEAETKIHILVGGPSVSSWFQNLNGNTVLRPENSLVYELIKFCYRNHLPLDFISWHSYSTDPKIDNEATVYKKTTVNLIRDWLSFFHFDRNLPLIIDEWNYDRYGNILEERKEKSYIAASYIPARLKQMYQAEINYQLYFCLEDFQNNFAGVTRNTGAFWFNPESSEYKGGSKCIYNLFRMLNKLGNKFFTSLPKLEDEFVGIIATRGDDYLAILVYNYLDQDISRNYLSRNISGLSGSEIKSILDFIQTRKLDKILNNEISIDSLRVSAREKALLNKTKELNMHYLKFNATARNLKLGIKNLKSSYLYQRYVIDSSCSLDCEFAPLEKKELGPTDLYQETLVLNPYSVQLIILKEKAKESETITPARGEQPGNHGNISKSNS